MYQSGSCVMLQVCAPCYCNAPLICESAASLEAKVEVLCNDVQMYRLLC